MNILFKKRCLSYLGFTLVELIMVIVIIGLLSAIIIPRFSSQAEEAAFITSEANLGNLRTALVIWIADNAGAAPPNLAQLVTDGYLPNIPEESLSNPGNSAETAGTWPAACADTGGWLYDSAGREVYINRTTCPFSTPAVCDVAEDPCNDW